MVLTPKAFAILAYLSERPGQLVTKAEFFEQLWPKTAVGDAALSVCMSEVRRILEDSPQAPCFIEAVHTRGYRFIAEVSELAPIPSTGEVPNGNPAAGAVQILDGAGAFAAPGILLGGDAELTQLQGYFAKVLAGERQIIFVTGEPGIGKTALVEEFIASTCRARTDRIGLGECIDHYGSGEAYLPVLAVLAELCRQPGGEQLIAVLMQRAPSWLVQMPGLLDTDALAALQQRTPGADRDRMLREMADALEVLATERPLVLWLEDLHWSDYATLDLIAYLARSRRPARLLVIGTYRPVDVIMSSHPLKAVKQELQMHGRCHELPLEGISPGSVAEYLTAHFPGNHFPADLSQKLYERTEGNPLLMANVVEDWTAGGLLKEMAGGWHLEGGLADAGSTVPENLRQMLEHQIERLDIHEQAVLEAAGVAGVEFSVAAVAAALETDAGEIEQRCETLTRRRQFLRRANPHTGANGAAAGSYRFLHALHRQVCEDRVPSIRTARLHLQVGRHQEVAYGKHSARIAGELAIHFERGGDVRRAIRYRMLAAEKALHTFAANKEAADHLTQALQLIRQHPELENVLERKPIQDFLTLVSNGVAVLLTPEVEELEGLTSETSGEIGDKQTIFQARAHGWMLNLARAKFHRAREASVSLLHAAEGMGQVARMRANLAAGMTSFYLGEFLQACEHLEKAVLLYDPQKH